MLSSFNNKPELFLNDIYEELKYVIFKKNNNKR